ncbi:MAG: hypothetical protein JXX29_03530 [Deltaproteobacteria bacterium]|nr:hypothetical protein [Deltaproteobacteria bacterium]MBN2670714.1 hypothetical protein [Deltaproteobacteria bacterium]
MKKAGLPRLIRTQHGIGLTHIADEVLLHHSSVISEGTVAAELEHGPVYSGSTMLTIDLHPLQEQFRGSDWPQQLVRHLEHSIYFRLAVMRLARREAEQRCLNGLLGELKTELEFTIERETLLVDIDVLGCVQRLPVEDAGSGEN